MRNGNDSSVTSGQLDVEHEQDDRDRHDRDEREHELLDAAVDQLRDGVHVGGQARDDTARRVALVEAHRQPLEVVEHALAQLEQDGLADPAGQREEAALGQVCDHDRHRERDRDLDHHGAVAVPYQRADAVVDAEHDQVRPGHVGASLQQQQDEEPNERFAVRPQERAEQRPALGAQPQRCLRAAELGRGPVGVVLGCDPTPRVHIDDWRVATRSSLASGATGAVC